MSRKIELHISEPLFAKLVTVAAKASGQDKPTADQIDNALGLLAHQAIDNAHAQATKPEPVAKPLQVGPMLALVLGLLLLSSGCAVIRYQAADGSRFTAWTCLADDKIAKLAVDKRTKATSTGLSIGAIDHAIDDDAVQAIVAGVVEGIVTGVK